MSSSAETHNNLKTMIRNASRSRLMTLAHRDDIKIEEIVGKQIVYGHWMSIILVSGKGVKILFNVHYQTSVAQFFAASIYQTPGKSEEVISQQRALDFFKEFCNLTGGHLKVILDKSNVRVGVSLPIMARGFDEVFYPRTSRMISDEWMLTCGNEKVFCSTHIELYDEITVTSIDVDEIDNSGEVSFL